MSFHNSSYTRNLILYLLEHHVIRHISQRLYVSWNIVTEVEESLSFGKCMADRVASYGGL